MMIRYRKVSGECLKKLAECAVAGPQNMYVKMLCKFQDIFDWASTKFTMCVLGEYSTGLVSIC